MLLRPARVDILLRPLGGLVGPAFRHVAVLDRLVFIAGVVVLRTLRDTVCIL